MSAYLLPIEAAIILFPMLAGFITLPYIIHQYRKYGSILFLRVAIVYSFVFYLLCSYFLVNLPLPPIEEVRHYTSPTMQLIPFQSLRELTTYSSFVWDNPTTYMKAFNEPSMYLIVFNIVLTIPFGMYLRYYFECTWKKTLLLTFLLTLSFECIQLSGLLGIYPRPYRLFDVDDLITNTMGGMIGYLITPLLSRLLPSRDNLDEEAFSKGQQVSSFRRVFAFFVDSSFLIGINYILYKIYTPFLPQETFETLSLHIFISYHCCIFLYFFLLPIFTKGKTLGKMLVKIKLTRCDEQKSKWYQYMFYYVILYCVVFPTPFILFTIVVELFSSSLPYEYLILTCSLALFIFYIFSIVQGLTALFVKDYTPWYARLSKLKNVSTIEIIEHSDEQTIDIQQAIVNETIPLESTTEEMNKEPNPTVKT